MERIAVVTGTSSGIGAAVAGQLLEKGWHVVGIARRPAVVRHDRYRHVSADLADVMAAARAIEEHVGPMLDERRWSRIALINNAATASDLGPVERVPVRGVLEAYTVNVVAPTWLMGFVLRHTPPDAIFRVVNVSSAAAVHPLPGLGPYAGSKAALRMASMVFAAELESADRLTPAPASSAVLSYEPGVVDTEMQTAARQHSPQHFPWVGIFVNFKRSGMLVAASAPAGEIVDFVERDEAPVFSEGRLGG